MKNLSVFPRSLRLCLLWLTLSIASASAAEISIVPIFTGWRETDSFKRISEYFNGKENTGGQVILRTHPDQRGGYYLLTRISTPTAVVNAQVVLQIITPDTATPRVFKFTATLTSPKTLLNLGLTGPDWPDRQVNPVAWQLQVLDAEGKLLATESSYLWEKPVTR